MSEIKKSYPKSIGIAVDDHDLLLDFSFDQQRVRIAIPRDHAIALHEELTQAVAALQQGPPTRQ